MSISFPYDTDYIPAAPVVTVTIRGSKEATVQALLDSGADATMIPIPLLKRVQARFARNHFMRGVIGQSSPVQLYFVEIQIGSHWIHGISAIAIESGGEAIIGRDVINHLIVTLDGIAGMTEIS